MYTGLTLVSHSCLFFVAQHVPNNHELPAERVSGDVVDDVASKRTKFVQSQEESRGSTGNNN